MFKIVAKTLAGLEEILAKEIETLGGSGITIGTRMVSYVGDKELLYKSNLWLRTALRVLIPIENFQAGDPDELYQQVKAIDWSRYIAEGQTIAIDNTIYSENFRNSRYAIYRAKDAICDWFVERQLKRPKVAVASADVQLNLHISETECTLSLDASGEPLYKRGYKEQLTDAPISEVLAAGILLKAGYDGTRDLYDPMCGSGTFLVEAALIATNTPAGLYRKGFGFQRWTLGEYAYDADLWQDLYDDDSQEREFTHHIYGSDISKVAIDATAANVRSAGLSKYITLEVRDFETLTRAPWVAKPTTAVAEDAEDETVTVADDAAAEQGALIIMNPPYGRRLFTDVPTFYRMVGNQLKRRFKGCEAWIISSDDPEATFTEVDARGNRKEGTPFDFVGLKASIKIDMNNGGIPCQLRKYELFQGRYDDFRREGGELDKQSADQKQDNSRYERQRRTGVKRADKGDKKDGGPKKRFFDKDGNAFERGHKRADSKDGKRPGGKKPFDRDGKKPFGKGAPRRTDGAATQRAYVVGKDGSITAASSAANVEAPQRPIKADKPRAAKPFADKKAQAPRADKKPAAPKTRGPRQFDPNRPMFRPDFDMSKAVLDYTQPDTKKDE